MDFSWTPEQLELRDAVKAFAEQALDHDVEAGEAAGTFTRDQWRACADFGIQGLPFPAEYGGSGTDALTTMLAMEALGYACKDQGLLFSLHAHMWAVVMPILSFGTDEQRSRYLPPMCDGTWVGGHGMTEPDSGSDAHALRTRAVETDEGYVLNGAKMFVTNAPEADVFVIFATVDPTKKMWGITAFIVERTTPGLTVGAPVKKLGLMTSPMSEVALEDVVVPAENMLGKIGQGSAIFGHSMGWERASILGSVVGRLERQLETCLEYVKTRRQFGQPVGDFQLVASRLVDMKVRLETARLLLYRAAWSQSQGSMPELEAAMTKLYVSEVAVESALDAIQVHGGYGYTKEYEIERDLRDAVGHRLYSGTSEIQRLIIARSLGLKPDWGGSR